MANQTQRYENASHGNFVMIAECALFGLQIGMMQAMIVRAKVVFSDFGF